MFPPEIFHEILKNVDIDTLKTCLKVNRALRYTSLYLLKPVGKFFLSNEDGGISFLKVVEYDEKTKMASCQSFNINYDIRWPEPLHTVKTAKPSKQPRKLKKAVRLKLKSIFHGTRGTKQRTRFKSYFLWNGNPIRVEQDFEKYGHVRM